MFGQRCANTLPFDHLQYQAMPQFRPLPPLEEVQKAFNYDSETGIITHAYTKCGRALEGAEAGFIGSKNYRCLEHDGGTYRSNRVAWLLGTGEDPGDFIVEHRNRNRMDNRLSNLRLATPLENSSNLCGKGWMFRAGKFRARVTHNGKTIPLGTFRTAEEAEKAYRDAKLSLCGEFAPQECK